MFHLSFWADQTPNVVLHSGSAMVSPHLQAGQLEQHCNSGGEKGAGLAQGDV